MSAHVTLQARVEQYLAERRRAGFELSTMGHGLARFARYVTKIGHHMTRHCPKNANGLRSTSTAGIKV